jgi:hypothetical protein
LGTDIAAEASEVARIEEIHDRRHLFVHRSGYADAEYVAKHPTPDAAEDKLLPVPETYLVEVLAALEASGLYIKRALEARYPEPAARNYILGDITLPSDPVHLIFISFAVLSDKGRTGFSDLSLSLSSTKTLKNIVVWLSDDGHQIRMLLGGDSQSITTLHETLRQRVRDGSIRMDDSFKVKR